MKLIAREVDADAADLAVMLTEADAKALGIKENDRVRIEANKESAVAVVVISDSFQKVGEICVIDEIMR
ncbi:MAG: molybdopterin dinucleotide binding domain-containing protein, partial [Candidatus Methanomethylophilaceae archaeon]